MFQCRPQMLTFVRVPFSSTNRGALLLTGGEAASLLQRQQKRLRKIPRPLGFLDGETAAVPESETHRATETVNEKGRRVPLRPNIFPNYPYELYNN